MDRLAHLLAILSTSFLVVIWTMHVCALANARLKLQPPAPAAPAKSNKRPAGGKARASLAAIAAPAAQKLAEQQLRQEQQQLAQQKQHTSALFNPRAPKTLGEHFCIELPLPGVSIIKPLVGVDRNLYRNLETFFHLDYPTYELLFCIQEPGDPAVQVVEQLFARYPKADARLFVGGARVGVNPKINNMQPAYEAMKYELLLISDSGISTKPDTLLDMVRHMQPDVALVHQMPFVLDKPSGPDKGHSAARSHGHADDNGKSSFQSIVERVYFGTAHARAYLTADLLNINCPTGMSALMRKCLLDEVGGIRAFGQYLAEDFFFAKSFTDRGWRICISSQPAFQNSANSSDSLQTLSLRIQRWIKLRFAMVPQWTLLEPFSECLLSGAIGAVSLASLWPLNPYLIFCLHVLLWFVSDYKLICTIQAGPLTCSKLDYLFAWLVRESTALIVFLVALTDSRVNWRSREFKLKWGGYAKEINPERRELPPANGGTVDRLAGSQIMITNANEPPAPGPGPPPPRIPN